MYTLEYKIKQYIFHNISYFVEKLKILFYHSGSGNQTLSSSPTDSIEFWFFLNMCVNMWRKKVFNHFLTANLLTLDCRVFEALLDKEETCTRQELAQIWSFKVKTCLKCTKFDILESSPFTGYVAMSCVHNCAVHLKVFLFHKKLLGSSFTFWCSGSKCLSGPGSDVRICVL